ncbi:MAG: TonB-dependent receptor [Flavobacteriales bacterium]
MRLLLSTLLVLSLATAFGQQRHTVSGYVKDATSGEQLIGANVYAKELMKGTATNPYGFYSLTLDAGSYTLVASFIGYEDQEVQVALDQDRTLTIELSPKAIMAKEFEVVGEKGGDNTESTDMGRIDLDVERLNTLPALLGEVDVLKVVQFLPGVQTNGEGNSGFYVRGGGPDQNLILLDEAIVYNATHLFGFFSVFNADAVKNIELIKGGMPANYGGRVSSVLDITMNDGNDKGFHGSGGIGLISSRLTLEGPLVKDRSSFIVSGRRTYIDVLTKPFINESSNFFGTGYYFYDLNAKLNYRLSDKDRFYVSGYFGRDVFDFGTSDPADPNFRIPWGNAIVSARWNHVFGPKLFMNTTATFSDYRFSFEAEQDQFAFTLKSGIKDYGLKVDLNHYASPRTTLKYGGQYIFHTYTPSTVTAQSGETTFDTGEEQKLYAHEAAAYALSEFDLTDAIRLNAGLRLSHFRHVGPYDFLLYDDRGEQNGVTEYGAGSTVKGYWGLEPRLSMRYRIDGKSSVKASYTRNYQYVHLASFSSISLPTDVWVPSSSRVKPQIGDQVAMGYFRDFKDRTYEGSVEVYYKDMRNLIEYAEGAEPQNTVNANFDDQFVFGDGYSYGLELFFKKRTGRLNGWVGYTWSRTFRTFDAINEGREFPSRWDRRHDVSVVAGYDLNERWTLGGTFVYATGQAVTLPVNRYWIEGRLVSEYVDRNGYRMAPYHRMDVSATLKNRATRAKVDKATGELVERTRKWRSSWTFAIYNVYNRANPYFIYFANEGNLAEGTFDVSARQVSLFSILPSVTWNFEF